MSEDQSWYDVIEPTENITQGDIIINCPIVEIKYPSSTEFKLSMLFSSEKVPLAYNVYEADVIVMSQACDLEIRSGQDKPKIDSVLVATLQDVPTSMLSNKQKGQYKDIGKLRYPNLYLLNKSDLDEKPMNFKVVEFESLYTIPWRLLNDYSKQNGRRLRLKSPYVLQLSQHFGHYFSRVGVPISAAETIDKHFKETIASGQ